MATTTDTGNASQGSVTWFTSDLHWGHKNIVKYTRRGEETTIEDHDQWLIDLWNRTVGPGDRVYHLGDFSWHWNSARLDPLLDQLHGEKIMVLGNHDRASALNAAVRSGRVARVADQLVINLPGGTPAHLFHFPIASWNGQSHGSIHLHGHSHGGYSAPGRIMDVGLDNSLNLLGRHGFFEATWLEDQLLKRPTTYTEAHRQARAA